MRILVTGGNGQLGREWADFLQSAEEVEFLVTSSSELDITEKSDLLGYTLDFNPDVIINCAAYTHVDGAEDDYAQALKVNEKAVRELASLCKKEKIRLVHYSTDYVFSGSEEDSKRFMNGYPETAETSPLNKYGKSKLAGEEAIIDSGCKYLVIRVSWLCGKYGENFVTKMLKLGTENEELRVVNDQFGSPTFTPNVVENSYALISSGQSGLFHLSSLGKTTWYEFAKEIFAQKKMNVTVEPVSGSEFTSKAKRPDFSLLNTEKIAKVSGTKLVHWKDALKDLLKSI